MMRTTNNSPTYLPITKLLFLDDEYQLITKEEHEKLLAYKEYNLIASANEYAQHLAYKYREEDDDNAHQ